MTLPENIKNKILALRVEDIEETTGSKIFACLFTIDGIRCRYGVSMFFSENLNIGEDYYQNTDEEIANHFVKLHDDLRYQEGYYCAIYNQENYKLK